MAELILLLGGQFGGGAGGFRNEEDGVIAKAIFSLGFGDYVPFPTGLTDDGGRVIGMSHEDQHTPETSSSQHRGQKGELLEQFGQIVLVAGIIPGKAG